MHGVELRDFTYKGLEGLGSGVGGATIQIRRDINTSGNNEALISIQNVRFIAASDYVVDSTTGWSGNGWADDSTPNETPFRIGREENGLYKDIIISNCHFDGVGYGAGVIYLDADNDFENINVFGNISSGTIDSDYGLVNYTNVDNAGTGKTLTSFQETSNVIKYES